jgi:catechol 2,3-dioxygenase-like lactoylglutathione lyase family enzyme
MIRPPLDQQVTFLFVRNLAATAAFYEEVLALPLVLDQGSCRIYAVSGGAFLGFCERSGVTPAPEGLIITLVSQAVHEWAAYLETKGVTLEKPPTRNETYNITHCFLRDPDGYLLEIQTFHDPDWPPPA